MKIDSHQHFWVYDPVKDAWIDDTMDVIKKDFSPEEVWPLMQENGIDGCVAVQADQSEQETRYLLGLADKHPFIKGVVGWIDFRAVDIAERLAYFSSFKNLKGFRHIVQAEPNDDFLLQEDFCRGISLLRKYGYTYDILIYPKHIKTALEFVKKFPDQPFIIDHLAKPFIKDQLVDDWKRDLKAFADLDHVSCKMAGLVTEADWHQWKLPDFEPYVTTVLDIFGTDRVMFGSDWPVCLTGASYSQVCAIVEESTAFLSPTEKAKLWGTNCSKIYRLSV
ncbi:amidohydrolase family protein [Chitinophaga sp. MM2321]|uniref:amidohydrolase family protein n=1 Tax=Chitinophaga sp. MM2321 TaxID=3137178 RepID=UPI0032D59101